MISTFSHPIRCVAERDSLPRIIIAFAYRTGEEDDLLVIDGDGKLEWLPMSAVVIDLRYDTKLGMWLDPVSGDIEDAFGEEG